MDLENFLKQCENLLRLANIEMLMGHDLGISRSYYKPTEKDQLIHLNNITIEELEQVIKKSTQLVSADKLAVKSLMDKSEESTNQNIPFNLVIPFENLRREMAFNNCPITSNMNIVFSGYFNQDTGNVFNPTWKITTE